MARLLWGIVLLAAGAATANAGARDYFTDFEKDFGVTPRGPVLQHYFLVKNTTQQTINIGQARVSCGCVSATVMKNQLAPGETTAVFAAMDTRRIPQPYVIKAVTVYVPFFNPVMEEVQLKVQAFARDDLVISPDTMAFGTVRMGQGASGSVKYTLYGNTNWQIDEATSTGAYVKPEVKQVAKTGNEVTFEVTAKLDPKCPAGNWTAEIWLKSPTPGLDRLRVPVTVNVTTPISITPEKIDLSGLAVGKETEHSVKLQGSQAFKVLQVKGVNDIFGVKAGTEESRPSHTLTITVKPKTAGDVATMLEILTDNKEMPSLTLPIKAVVPKR